jgi:hypothetical protein
MPSRDVKRTTEPNLLAWPVHLGTRGLRVVVLFVLVGTALMTAGTPVKAVQSEDRGEGGNQASACAHNPPGPQGEPSCGYNGGRNSESTEPSCIDGRDNEADGAADGADAECTDADDGVEDGYDGDGNSLHPTCTDGLDNDGGDQGAKDEQDSECTDPNDGVEDGSDERCHVSGGDEGAEYGALIPEAEVPDSVPLVGRVGPLKDASDALDNQRSAGEQGTIAERYSRGGGDQGFGPLTEDPEGNGVVSGVVRDAGDGTANEPVTNEVACAVDLLILETASPVDP